MEIQYYNQASMIMSLCISIISQPAAHSIDKYVIVKPFFTKETTITAITNILDNIEEKGLGYPDYGLRTGLIWSEFWTDTDNPNPIEECKDSIRLTQVEEQSSSPKSFIPESVFTYPKLRKILARHILPKMFTAIREHTDAPIAKKFFTHLYIQRCHTSTAMDWHQDPGEDHDRMALYSLVLMLSKQNDPVYGWQGGEFRIRPRLTDANTSPSNIHTIIHQYNQAILFNNQCNSHRAEAVTSNKDKSKRDLMVVMVFEQMPKLLPRAIQERRKLLNESHTA